VGTNRRYADRIDEQMNARVVDAVARGRQPETLTPLELQLSEQPMTRPPRAIPVRVWVRYAGIAIEVDAEAVAWTPRATAIRWRTTAGDVQQAWVWSSAVSPRE